MSPDNATEATDLRGLKNAVNFFSKKNNNTLSNRYVQNPIQQNQDPSPIYSTAEEPLVYSVASSQLQAGKLYAFILYNMV